MNYLLDLLKDLDHNEVGYQIGKTFKEYCENLGLETLVGYPREYHNKYLEEFLESIRKGFQS